MTGMFTEWLGKLSRDILSISAVLVLIGPAMWWMFGDKLEPYIEIPEDVKKIAQTLEENKIQSPPVFIEVHSGFVDIGPYEAGDTMTIAYYLQRNRSCPTTLVVRFWSMDSGAYRAVTTTQLSVEASLSTSLRIFPIQIKIPDDLTDGTWAYHPTLICGEQTVSPPPIFFKVENKNA